MLSGATVVAVIMVAATQQLLWNNAHLHSLGDSLHYLEQTLSSLTGSDLHLKGRESR